MAAGDRRDVVRIADLIAQEEQVYRRYSRYAPRIGSSALKERIERVAREALDHADRLREALGLPPASEPGAEADEGPGSGPGATGAPTTWQGLVECVRLEARLAEGYREAAAQAADPRLKGLLGRLGGEEAAHRNEVSLVAALVTSFVP